MGWSPELRQPVKTLPAGTGDELQGMKRGIFEMSDLIAINKADGDNRERAECTRREYENALHLFRAAADGWVPRVVICSAFSRDATSEIWRIVLQHRAQIEASGWFERHRREQALDWMKDALLCGIEEELRRDTVVSERLAAAQRDVSEGQLSPFLAARQILALFRREKRSSQGPTRLNRD
ncbi:MAG TPA: hypothetical protein VIX19_08155 [Terriglobales bacterium]